VARVRGTSLSEALAFVRERYGPDALARVRKALPPKAKAVFQHAIREVNWYPLDALTSFLITARDVLDPGALEFYRAQGHYAAQKQKKGPLHAMVKSHELRVKLVRTVWRMFYDAGRVEVVGHSPAEAVTRIHDFPATPELCERFRGIWEGMSSTDDEPARAEETRCVLRGDPYCELRLTYGPAPPAPEVSRSRAP
jgi:hypothetical protein